MAANELGVDFSAREKYLRAGPSRSIAVRRCPSCYKGQRYSTVDPQGIVIVVKRPARNSLCKRARSPFSSAILAASTLVLLGRGRDGVCFSIRGRANQQAHPASIITSLFMCHLSCAGAFCAGGCALAGSGDLLPACIPVKIARGKSTTLYLLPACFARVKCIPGATELNALLELTAAGSGGAKRLAGGKQEGLPAVTCRFPRPSTVKRWKNNQ